VFNLRVQYLVDDSSENFTGKDRINFVGRLDDETNADYVNVRFRQEEDLDGDGGTDVSLFKSAGSFWVGISPECFIAICTAAFLESLKPHSEKVLRNVSINGHLYDINVFNGGNNPRSIYPSLPQDRR